MNEMTLNQNVPSIEVHYRQFVSAADLRAQAKHAHLIERGARSLALRKLFDRVVTDIQAYSDQLEKLAAAFDSFAMDEVQPHPDRGASFASSDGAGFGQGQRPLLDIASALIDFGESVHAAIDENARGGNDVEAHLFGEVLRDIEEQFAAVEYHLALKKRDGDKAGTARIGPQGTFNGPTTWVRWPDPVAKVQDLGRPTPD